MFVWLTSDCFSSQKPLSFDHLSIVWESAFLHVFEQVHLLIWYFLLWVFFSSIDLILQQTLVKASTLAILTTDLWSLTLLFILTTLTDELCITVFQLLIFQEELSKSFLKDLQEILALIKNTRFRSIIVKSRTRQIRSKSIDSNNNNSFFSSDWVIDKSLLRKTIKQFLLDTEVYRLSFQKSRKSEKISQPSTSSFTENKSFRSSLALFKHKHDSSNSSIISIIWSKVIDIFQNPDTMSSGQSSSNILVNLDLTSKQMQTLSDIISVTVNIKINRLNNELRQLLQTVTQASSASSSTSGSNVRHEMTKRSFKEWTSKEMRFFDPTTDELRFVINLEKHVFYKNVYVFVNRLKNMTSLRDENKLKIIISQCLRRTALIWHFIELFDIEKDIYKEMSVDNWCTVLVKRFKEKTSTTLINIQSTKYILEDAREQKNSRVFAQNIFRHVKVVEMTSIYSQFCIA